MPDDYQPEDFFPDDYYPDDYYPEEDVPTQKQDTDILIGHMNKRGYAGQL